MLHQFKHTHKKRIIIRNCLTDGKVMTECVTRVGALFGIIPPHHLMNQKKVSQKSSFYLFEPVIVATVLKFLRKEAGTETRQEVASNWFPRRLEDLESRFACWKQFDAFS